MVHFIMEHEQLSYPDALRYLARKYNIEIKERELTEEEKQEARQKALRQYQDEELRKMQNRQRARAAKPQKPQVEPSLFDFDV